LSYAWHKNLKIYAVKSIELGKVKVKLHLSMLQHMWEWMYSCKHLRRNEIQSFHFGSHPTVPVFISHMNANKYFENVADLRYLGITEL